MPTLRVDWVRKCGHVDENVWCNSATRKLLWRPLYETLWPGLAVREL